jgi:putative membrane protein
VTLAPGQACHDRPVKIIIRVVITAISLWVATLLIHGITLHTANSSRKALTLLAVAVIFGVINALLKPVIKTLGCVFYVLTLGLFALIVNALLFELTSWAAGRLHLPFHVSGFMPAFWGAIIVGVVSWLLNMFVHDDNRNHNHNR